MKKVLNNHGELRPMAAAILACLAAPLQVLAQSGEQTLPAVTVEGARSVSDRNQYPVTTESMTAGQVADTVNAVTVEDALKYLPNVLVRRRFIGDTQAPMATRTTGINASARSLIFVDGILLSTLVNNNNQNGSPQWFMVAPDEIDRIDVLYGPFAAAYPGNSYGAVTEIVTRMPRQFEASAKATAANQNFSQYGTRDHYSSTQASVNLGNRAGDLSWWFSVNHLNSFSQPVTYLTINQSATAVTGSAPVLAGAIADRNRTGAPIQVLGAGNLTHTVQDTAKLKLAYDVSPALTAAYTLGYWQNNADASSQSYLTTATGAPYFGGTGSVNIAGNAYSASSIGSLFFSNSTDQAHWMQALSLKTKNSGPLNWEVIATHFNYGNELTRTSIGPYPLAQSAGPGRTADASDTGWTTLDVKGTWRQKGRGAQHSVSVGAHADQYKLANPTYSTSDWINGGKGALFSDSRGKTRTEALWVQDVWRIAPDIMATIGGRYERWRAYDGFNFATSGTGRGFPVTQPEVSDSTFSPKLSLAWQATNDWSMTGSFGKALRFPTVGELYQNVQTGQSFTQANPFLKPEKVLAGELALERRTSDSKLRVSLFGERVSDALISQTSSIPGVAVPVSFVQNVDMTRQRGIEFVGQKKDVLIKGLELNGSLTYVDARIKANAGYVATTSGAASVGKRTPYVPEWRATAVATYKPDEKWSYTLAGRYSSRLYATVDNTDINPATYQGFEGYFVADLRIRYQLDRHWRAAAGIDNLNNRKYILFHPFPQRTLYAELKYDF